MVLFDHVGAGKSDLTSTAPISTAACMDMSMICWKFLTSWRCPVIFVGHSVGAMIGVLAAMKRPIEFDRLVLIGPSPRYINAESEATRVGSRNGTSTAAGVSGR